MEPRFEYLLECFRTAHEELLARVKQRDDWIKIQLAAQVVLAALASGIELFGARAARPATWVALLALPVSLVLCLLVSVEDRLVGHLARYLRGLSAAPEVAAGGAPAVLSFDASEEVGAFGRETLHFRTAALISVFLVIPLVLGCMPLVVEEAAPKLRRAVAAFNSTAALFIAWVLISNHRFRKRIAQGTETPAAAERAPGAPSRSTKSRR